MKSNHVLVWAIFLGLMSAGQHSLATTSDCATSPPGLVSWWKAEGDALDSIGTNHGVMFNPKFYTGKVGLAFSTGGIYVTVSNSPSLRFTNAITVEAWVNPALLGNDTRAIISKFDYINYAVYPPAGTNSSFYLGVTDGGRLFFSVSPNGSPLTNARLIAGQSLPLNQWTFVVATYDGAALRLYTNAVLAAQTNYSGGIFAGTSALGIGALPYFQSFVQPFSGLIDEVTLYNRALSQAQILSIYNAGSNGKCFPPVPACTETPSGLVSWWPADGNALDAMGTNNASFASVNYVTGKVDRAFNFNGTTSRVTVPTSASLDFGSNADFSIEAWIKTPFTNTTYPNVPLIEKRPAVSVNWWGWSLSLNQGRLAFAIRASDPSVSVSNYVSSGPDLRDSLYHHIAVSLNRGSTNGGNLYVDGQSVLTFDPTPHRSYLFNQATLYLGAPTTKVSNSYFLGQIDEPAIYSRALTPTEIGNIFNSGARGKCKMTPAILVGPLSQRVTFGSNAMFTVTAAGSPKLRYQWLFNGLAVPNATNSFYAVSATVGGNYSVRVTNLFGAITSSNALLTINNAPEALKQAVILNEDMPAVIVLTGSDRDQDTLAYFIVTLPAHGALTGSGRNWLYTPAPNYHGPDSFTFKVNDGFADSAPATVSITVLPVNDPPIAQSQSVTLDEDTTVTIALGASDADDDALTFSVNEPAHGTLSGMTPNLSYRPDTNYFGPDGFTFTVSDGQTNSNIATVSITVNPVNDAPIAKINVGPLTELPGFTNQIILSPLTDNAAVVLDGSDSSDVENDLLQFFWWEGTNNFASGMIVTNEFSPNTHHVTLIVSDGQATGTNSTTFEVLTPAQSVGLIISLLQDANLGGKNDTPLLASLNAAVRSFERGNVDAALNELKAFQNKVRAQISSSNPDVAAQLVLAAQKIVDNFNPPEEHPQGKGRAESVP